MRREDSVLNDFIGFSSSGDRCCRHEDSAHDDGPAIFKLGSFRMAAPGGPGADSCVTTAARGVQAQVEETLAEKQGPSILVVALKGLERSAWVLILRLPLSVSQSLAPEATLKLSAFI